MAEWLEDLPPNARAQAEDLLEEAEEIEQRIAEVKAALVALDLNRTYAAGVAVRAACEREIEEERRLLEAYLDHREFLAHLIETVRLEAEEESEEEESDLSDVERMEDEASAGESELSFDSEQMSVSDVDFISTSSSSDDSSSDDEPFF